jgi:molecular chaperone IbpA
MTYLKDVFGRDLFKDFDKVFVGYDDQFNRLAKMHDDITKHLPSYPPYNIKKVEDNKYVIEIAVAGFTHEDIDIEFAEDKLTIKGHTKDGDESHEWLHRGIAARNFTRTFVLNDQIEVKDADLSNGMLKINLERIIPEHKKPRKINLGAISQGPTKKELLVENELSE